MRAPQAVVAALLLISALVLQETVASRLPLPLGPPDLVVVVLVSLALVTGPLAGLVLGFGSGLVADLVSDHHLGRLALVLALVGYGAGFAQDEAERTLLVPIAAVAAGTAAAVLLYAGTGALLGEFRAGGGDLAHRLAGAVLYDVLLTPFVFPAVRGLVTRLDPERRP